MAGASSRSNHRRPRALAAAAGVVLLLGVQATDARASPPAEPEAKGTTATVLIPPDLHARILSGAGGASTAYLLRIDGVQLPANQPAVIHVFGNLPEAANLEELEDSPHYLGDFTIIPRTLESAGPAEKTEIALDVTGSLPVLLKNSRTLTVTLIPAGGYRPDKDLKLRFEKMYVTEER